VRVNLTLKMFYEIGPKLSEQFTQTCA
jgi:hypothetical protein